MALSSCVQKLDQIKESLSRHTMHIPMLQQTRAIAGPDAALKSLVDVSRLHQYDKKLLPQLEAIRKTAQKLHVRLASPVTAHCLLRI